MNRERSPKVFKLNLNCEFRMTPWTNLHPRGARSCENYKNFYILQTKIAIERGT